LLCLCGCGGESGYPTATNEFYVNDFANVITESDEQKMLSDAVALAEKTTAQVVVVTIEDLDGQEAWEYALELGRQWGVGDEEQDNGVVVLLSTNDREIYIAVGYGLEGALPDSKTGRIIDVYGLEYLKNNDFSSGLTAITSAVVNEVYIEYGITNDSGYVSIDNIQQSVSSETEGGKVVVSWIVMVVLIIIYLSLYRKFGASVLFFGGPRFPRGGGGFSGGGSFRGGGFSGGGGSFGGGGAGRGF